MEEVVKRGPGRPPQQEQLKKGNSSWKPAALNDFIDKEPGYRYRMVRKDQANLSKKQKEGWETVSGIQSSQTNYVAPNKIENGVPLTSVQEGPDWVLQRIPEEVAQNRDKYFDNMNEKRMSALTAHSKQELAKAGVQTHGEITISSQKGN